jgi:oligopeptide transport system ATP-binding protein
MNRLNSDSDILSVENLTTRFHTPEGTVFAVNGVSFTLRKGETLGVVGESGSGKSVTMMSLLQLIPQPPGEIISGSAIFDGKDLLKLHKKEIRKVRGGKIGMIFQDPMTSLNPVLPIGLQVAEPLIMHRRLNTRNAKKKVIDLLHLVGIPEPEKRLGQYPHQFSGGMRQRVMIAMALASDPDILIADEPTTALDVTIQAQIIELVKKLRDELGMSMIWITHDLGIIAGLAHRVLVMYAGLVIEEARVKDLYAKPRHPYTAGLLNSLPRIDQDENTELVDIPGMPPLLMEEPKGCPFAPRCSYSFARCQERPTLIEVGPDHRAACWWDLENGRPVNA